MSEIKQAAKDNKPRVQPAYQQTEIGIFPSDWAVKKLGEIAEIKTGTTPPTNDRTNYGDDYYFVSPADLGKGKYIIDTEKKLSSKGYEISRIYPKNSILFTCIGSTIGKSGIAKIELTSNQQINAILPNENFITDYVFYSLNISIPRIKASASEQAVPMINKSAFETTLLALPPTLTEQTAIATALSDADSYIGSIEKLIAKKRFIKQGAMQELLKPKEGWVVKKLGEIAEIKDGTHQTPKYVDAGIPFYSVENVTRNEFVNTKYISQEEHSFLTKNFKIEKGDILMTRIGSIGDCKYVDWDVNASFYVSLALLKIRSGFSSAFICHYSKSHFFQKEIELNSLQSAIPKKINLGPISNIGLFIPKSETEQILIATILSDMDAEIAVLEKKLNKAKQIKQGMMQNLLTGKIRLV